jgi:hypothetical protein
MTTMPVVPDQGGRENLQPLALAGQSTQLWLAAPGRNEQKKLTSVLLSDQGLVQVLEAAVTGLEPGKPYVLALARPSSTRSGRSVSWCAARTRARGVTW